MDRIVLARLAVAAGLAAGVRPEPGSEPFGADVPAGEPRAMLDRFPRPERGRIVAAARGDAA